MKKVITILFLMAFSLIQFYAQTRIADSLKVVLAEAEKPMEQFDALNSLLLELVGWKGDNVDSTYCIQMLHIAQQLKNDSLLAISYNWLGSYFYQNKGDNATGLEYFYKALPLAQKHNDKRRISSLYFDIALVYFDLQNLDEALLATQRGGQNLPDENHPLYNFMLLQYLGNMADYFLRVGHVDSAFHYVAWLEETVQQIKNTSYELEVLSFWGASYALANNPKQADEYFGKALAELSSVKSSTTNTQFYGNYIPYLMNHYRIAEAQQQASNLLKLGIAYDNNNLKLAGAGFLRQVFDRRNEIDSAYYYSQMEASINAEIFSQNNRIRIQALAFNDQLRAMEARAREEAYQNQLKLYVSLTGLGLFTIIAFILFRNNRQKQKANKVLEATLSNLKSTQAQLVQQEKLASLGQLTAGIAHEIQNPLNFVNNFSEVSIELVDEMNEELAAGSLQSAVEIANDIKQNMEKINHHGQRAATIIKSMLQHSRSSSGKMTPTDLNALIREYVNLSYHGMRAGKEPFNVSIELDLDESMGQVSLIVEDFSRVIVNICNNAFDAMRSVETQHAASLLVRTKKHNGSIVIAIEDNGPGIPDEIKDKILQPFFTTKKGTQGAGLGLSITHDIVKAHGGELKVETKEGEGTRFVIQLPLSS